MDVTKEPNSQSTEPASKPRRKKASGGVKETIESILIAFILAFVFRAFVVEAFVIPTGSMATTLMGAHMNFTCTDCGYKWRVNYNAQQVGDDLRIPPRAWVDVLDRRGRRWVVVMVVNHLREALAVLRRRIQAFLARLRRRVMERFLSTLAR